jgi:hypothetical protein
MLKSIKTDDMKKMNMIGYFQYTETSKRLRIVIVY